VESRAERLTGDAGAVALREILERSGLVEWIPQLSDPRRREDVVHDLPSLIRTGVLLAAQGWRDHDDADALRDDPAFQLAASSASGRTPLDGPHGLASQPTLSRFTAIMAEPANRSVLRKAALELGARAARAERGGKRPRRLTLDVDSLPIELHGHQPKAEWNGHYRGRIYHPLITSVAETGDMLDARLRANPALDRLAAPYMTRSPGRRPAEPRMWLQSLTYQADSWDRPRCIVLVVKEREDDLLLDCFFLVTSRDQGQMSRREVLDHYRERGTAEDHMGELKDVLAPALSSTNRPKSHWRGRRPRSATEAVDAFACNEVRLLISVLTYQLMHIARPAMARATGTGWNLRERVLRVGFRLLLSFRPPDDPRALQQRRAFLGSPLPEDRPYALGRFLIATA
jgi:hypothetical protein